MLDWLRELLGNGSKSKSLVCVRRNRCQLSHQRALGRKSSSRSSRGMHSKSSSSLKNETMMLEAQRLFLSMGLALTSTKNSKSAMKMMTMTMCVGQAALPQPGYYLPSSTREWTCLCRERSTASNLAILQKNKITHIVNCTRLARRHNS